MGGRGQGHANAAVALYVKACLAQREPVVIAARLAAGIVAERTAYLVALRQASHAISEGMFPAAGSGAPHEPPPCAAVAGGTDLTGPGRPASAVGRCAGTQRSRRVVGPARTTA